MSDLNEPRIESRTARWLLAGVAALVCACTEDSRRPESSAPALGAPTPEPPARLSPPEQAPEPEPPALCLLAGAEELEREDAFTTIAFDYYAQTNECQARRLISTMGDIQTGDWLNYLINYSSAFFGCGLLFEPLPGGVDAFGPAHTEAVGIPNPRLAAEDAALLIDLYLTSCTNAVPVPSAELAELRARLEAAAQPQIAPDQAVPLSECL